MGRRKRQDRRRVRGSGDRRPVVGQSRKPRGFHDGEDIAIAFAEQIIGRIARSVDVPVSADFEGGYTDDDSELSANVARLLQSGIAGINFEDRVVKGSGL